MIVEPPVIHVTDEYEKFSLLSFNRKIKHLNKLYTSIDRCNKLYLHPIIVTPSFKIIDGQHRWQYAKDRAIHFYYIVDKYFKASDLIAHNNTASNWIPREFAEFYSTCDQAIINEKVQKDYQLSMQLHEIYNLSFEVMFRLYCSSSSSTCSTASKKFRDGTLSFRFEHKDILESTKKMKFLIDYLKSQKFFSHCSTELHKALYLLVTMPDYCQERVISKMDKNFELLNIALKFSTANEIYNRLLAIYNKNSRKNYNLEEIHD